MNCICWILKLSVEKQGWKRAQGSINFTLRRNKKTSFSKNCLFNAALNEKSQFWSMFTKTRNNVWLTKEDYLINRPNTIIPGLQQYARENCQANDISNIINKNYDVSKDAFIYYNSMLYETGKLVSLIAQWCI